MCFHTSLRLLFYLIVNCHLSEEVWIVILLQLIAAGFFWSSAVGCWSVSVQYIDTATAPVSALNIRCGSRWKWSSWSSKGGSDNKRNYWSCTWDLSVSILFFDDHVFVKCLKLLNIVTCSCKLAVGVACYLLSSTVAVSNSLCSVSDIVKASVITS